MIHPCAKFGMPLSKRKDDFAKTQIQDEVKGHGRTEVMKMFDTSCHGITLMCQIWYYYVKVHFQCRDHECTRHNVTCAKYGKPMLWMDAPHRLMVIHQSAKYGVSHIKANKCYGPDTNLPRQTDGQTDWQTDRQSDYFIPHWTSFMGVGYNKRNLNPMIIYVYLNV